MRSVFLNALVLAVSVGVNVATMQRPKPAQAASVQHVNLVDPEVDAAFEAAIANGYPTLPDDSARMNKIVAREIVLVDEDGKPRITILAGKHGSGIWVGDHNGLSTKGSISMFEDHGRVALGFYAPGVKRSAADLGCDFAIGAEPGGPPHFQVRDDKGQLNVFEIHKLKP